MNAEKPRTVIRTPEVSRRLGIKITQIKLYEKLGEIPQSFPVTKTGRTRVWWEHEIDAHLAAQAALRATPEEQARLGRAETPRAAPPQRLSKGTRRPK